MLVVATSSSNIKFHQWQDGVAQQTYVPSNCDEKYIKSLSWSKDGSWLVLVPGSGEAEIISIASNNVKLLQKIDCILQPTCATFQNSTKRIVAVGTLSGQALVYDVKDKKVRNRFPPGRSSILHIRYNANDTHLAASCANGEILLFSNTTSFLSTCYNVPKSSTASALGFHRSRRNMLAAGSEEGVVALWDINTNAMSLEMQAHQAPVTALAFSPIRSDMLVTSALDRRFAFHDIVAKNSILEIEVKSSITALDFSSCGTYLGLGSHNGGVVLYDIRNMNKPISAFTAYDGKRIGHLLLQRVLSSDDKLHKSKSDVVMAIDDTQRPRESSTEQSMDFLEFMTGSESPQTATGELPSRKPPEDNADSFLEALGLDGSSTSESGLRESATGSTATAEFKKRSASRYSSVDFQLPPQQKVLQQQFSSSPRYLPQDLPTYSASPIIAGNIETPPNKSSSSNTVQPKNSTVLRSASTSEEQAKMLKEVTLLREALKAFKNEINGKFTEIKEKVDETQHQIRIQFLHLHLSMCKQFVDLQTALEAGNNELMKKLDSFRE